MNIKSRPTAGKTAGKTSRQTVTENSNVKVLSTTIRNASSKVPLDPLNLKGKRSHTKHFNARGNYIQINKIDAQTRVSEDIQRSELSVPEVTHLGNRKSNDKQQACNTKSNRLNLFNPVKNMSEVMLITINDLMADHWGLIMDRCAVRI